MADATNGHRFLTAGLDRYAANGNATVGFWFFQSPVSVNANGTFSGVHTDGDLLLVVDFTVGGSNPVPGLYRWTGNDATGSLVPVTAPAGAAFATVPSTPTAVPWAFVDKQGFTTPQVGEFLQAGVDLTAVYGANVPRFVSFLTETRSSASTTSTLSDFALGSVNNVGTSYTVKAGQYGNTVLAGRDVRRGAGGDRGCAGGDAASVAGRDGLEEGRRRQVRQERQGRDEGLFERPGEAGGGEGPGDRQAAGEGGERVPVVHARVAPG
jgi:hypothetical protein